MGYWLSSFILSCLVVNQKPVYRAFSYDVTRPYWCTKNNETAAILVCQVNPVVVEAYSEVNTFFCSNKFA